MSKVKKKNDNEVKVPVIGTEGIGGITFYGDKVDVAFKQDKVYVLLRTLCENMGLAWGAQRIKILEHELLKTCVSKINTQVSGQNREVLALDVDYLPYYLALIQPNKVAQHLRPKIIAYQKEVADVLKQYFYSGAAVNPKATLDPTFLQDALAGAVDKAVEKVQTNQHHRMSNNRLEHLKYLIEIGANNPKIDSRSVNRAYELYTNAVVGEITVEKRQIDIAGFLKDKIVHTRGNAISFGHFLSKFHERMTGTPPKCSVTMINGRETYTKYYTLEDLELIEDAFEEWTAEKNIEVPGSKTLSRVK